MQQSAGISSTVGSQIPGHLTSQIIPGAEWVYIDLHHSQALLQEITIDGFALAKFAAMETRAVTFKIVPTQSIVALLYMIAGELAFSINGLQDAFFKNENRLCILPSGNELIITSRPAEQTMVMILVPVTLFKKLTKTKPAFNGVGIDSENTFLSLSSVSSKSIQTALNGIIRRLREAHLATYYLNESCMHLIQYFIRNFNYLQYRNEKKILTLNELESYISNNLSAAHRKVLVTSLLAKKTGLSKPRFARHFYKTFGCSARVYIQSKRMSSALHFLTTSDMAIGEIADAIGYADFSSFTRAFKKYHGLIPFAVKRSGNPKP